MKGDRTTMYQAAEAMYNALKNLPCICVREFMYSGVGKDMCGRCKAMVMWECSTTGASETEREFKAKKL